MIGYSKKALSLMLAVALALPAGMQSLALKAYAEGEDILSGSVKIYGYGKAESTAEGKSEVPVSITLKNDEKVSVTSGERGAFSYEVPLDKKTDSSTYEASVASTEEYLSGSASLKAGEEGAVLIQERYVASSSDFTLPDQEGAAGGKIKDAGTYTINGAAGKKLSKTLDGEAAASIEVSIDGSGKIEPFYVYPGDTCSKPFTEGSVPIDKNGPSITGVSTAPGDGSTYVKAHGIYGKTKANIIVTASITEEGAGLDEVYIVGKKDGEETRYEATKVSGQNKYTATIGLPSEETILDAETMYLVATDLLGNKTEALIARNEDASSVTLEIIAPEIAYEVTPATNEHGYYKALPTIKAKATDDISGVSKIEIFQDGSKIASRDISEKETEEVSLEAKAREGSSPDNKYTFKIEATDNSGNKGELSFTLKIDTAAPVVTITGVKEDESYKEKPSIEVSTDEKVPGEAGNSISVVVKKNSSTETLNKVFEKVGKLTIPETAFQGDGEYQVYASAVDAAGNASEEECVTFIYDATKPMVSIGPMSQPNGNGWYKTLPVVSAASSDVTAGLLAFDISEDGKSLWSKEYEGRVRKIQTAEAKAVIEEASDDGSYTFTARAEDKAGNVEKKSMKLKIDLEAPKLSTSGVTSGTHYRNAPSIKIDEEEKYYKAKGAYISYAITRDGKSVANKTEKQVNSVKVPESYLSKDGNYKLTITAEDAAGNKAKSLSYSFVVDGTKPVISLTGAENGKFYSSARRITLTVTERYYKTNNVKVSAVRSLGGNHNVGFPWSNEGRTSSSSKTFSETGTYTITANATDKAGNKAQGKSLTFTVDTKAPVISITGVEDKRVYKYGESVAPHVSVKDDYPGSQSVVYTKGGEIIQNPDFSPLKENDGTYTMTVTATDKAGNTASRSLSFVINRFGSYFVYPDETKAVMGKAMQSQSSDIVIKEHNVSKLKRSDKIVTRDGKKIESDAKTTEKLGEKENVYTHTFSASNFSEEGKYEINVASEDEAENTMESKEENGPVVFYVDRSAPTLSLSGIDPKGNRGSSAVLTITTADTLTGVKELHAKVGGEEVSLNIPEDGSNITFTVGEGLNQDIEITSTDGAGNTETLTDQISVSESAIRLFLNRFLWPVLAAVLAALAGLFFLIFKRRKKEDSKEV